MAKIILFNKPFGVLSQFTDDSNRPTLAQFIKEKGFYPAGRLDKDSEGLLLLTNDGVLQQKISNPKYQHWKSYWVQVEKIPTEKDLDKLRHGIQLKDGKTLPAKVAMIKPPHLWQRDPPIRVRPSIPDCWLNIQICQGKNRQVRRMTAAIGFPTLRLIRHSIWQWQLNDLPLGQYQIKDHPII